jgi:hypothetical protein
MHSRTQPFEPKPIRIGDRPPSVPPIEPTELAEVIGRVLPVDLIATLHGRRGAALHIGGGA